MKQYTALYAGPGMYARPDDKAHNCSFVFEIRFDHGKLNVVDVKHYWGSENETMWGRACHQTSYANYGDGWEKEDKW